MSSSAEEMAGRAVGDAELYQRLRAHLAFLGLSAAAEALPGC